MVVMPFAAADRPSIAAGLLKALLAERGIPCDCKYFNVTFSKLAGHEPYTRVSLHSSYALAGEWMFSQVYYGESFSSWKAYRREILRHPSWGVGEEYLDAVERLRKVAPAFLRIAYEACDWSRYGLVAFTCNFEQVLPSLCLARMIKRHHPGVKIAFGGTNFAGPMGPTYFELFPEIDYLSTGEAEVSFPELCGNLARGDAEVPAGFLHRGHENGRNGGSPTGRAPLDSLPLPDYDEFFSALGNSRPHPTYVMLEASRGCWWGQKHHCTFCGFERDSIVFRRKDWRRVASEAAALQERYDPSCLFFVDSILAMEYFNTLLAHWAESGDRIPKFFEIKSNLKREHVETLRKAQVLFVQPGIESLSDRTLGIIDKGVTAAQNVALLRWCRELGIRTHWNILFGFPGEDLEDYPRTYELMQRLTHLQAPEVCGPIRMDRFSPNHDRWREQGFLDVRPLPAYRHIYPLDEAGLGRLAYYFAYTHADSKDVLELARDIIDFGAVWRESCEGQGNGTFAVRPHLDGGWTLVDDRFNRPRPALRLGPDDLLLLRLCDAPTTPQALFEAAARVRGGRDAGLGEAYERLLARDAICQVGKRILTLPLLPDMLRQASLS